MKPKLLLLLSFFLLAALLKGNGLFAQNGRQKKIDSLVSVLAAQKDGEEKIKLLTDISFLYLSLKPDEGIKYGLEALALSEKIQSKEGEASAYMVLGVLYGRKSDPQALPFLQKSLKMFEEQNNKPQIAATCNFISQIYSHQGNNTEAIRYGQRCVDISEALGNKKDFARDLGVLAVTYTTQSNYVKAIELLLRALKISEEIGDKPGMIPKLGNLGVVYMQLKEYQKAIEYFSRSMEISMQTGNKNVMATCIGNIGNAYFELKNYSKSLEYNQKALQLNEEMGDQHRIAANLHNIGEVFFVQNEVKQSMDYFQKALAINVKIKSIHEPNNLLCIGRVYLAYAKDSTQASHRKDNLDLAFNYLNNAKQKAKEAGLADLLPDINQSLSDAYVLNGNYTGALEKYKEYIVIRDSLNTVEKQNEITRKELQYEYGKKEDSLMYQQYLTDEKLKQQTLISQQQHQLVLLRQNQLDLVNKEKDLQHLAYLNTQAELEAKQSKLRENEKQLTIIAKENSLHQAQLQLQKTQLELDASEIRARKKDRNLVIGFAILIIAGLISFHFVRTRILSIRKKEQLKTIKAEAEMKALRAQMNPHFIFNCLNTIDFFIHKNQLPEASAFLHKFSALVRKVLESSRYSLVSLENDVEALELYIQLEQHRSNYTFDYVIDVDGKLRDISCKVPPMLIQPFVENAILHGLRNKKNGKGLLQVSFSADQEFVNCTVDDNGIGRIKAGELTKQKARSSLGLQITEERLAILKQTNGKEARFEFFDKQNHEGTTVNIILPKLT